MGYARIPDLPVIPSLTGAELIEVDADGVTGQATLAAVIALSGGGAGRLLTTYISNVSPLNVAALNNLLTIIRQGTPSSPLIINLPPTPVLNLMVGFKDGAGVFLQHNALVKTTDGLQIDGIVGTTGYAMNQNRQQNWFLFDGVMWDVL